MKVKNNYIFNTFLLFYFIFGFYFSIKTGITTDELENLYSWQLNLQVIKEFFGDNEDGYTKLEQYIWRYKGVGFYYFSHVYLLIIEALFEFANYPEIISKALLNHGLIFSTFFLSALFAKKILHIIIKDKFYSNIFLLFYLSYPYLIGHGFFNTTDTPFLFAWILSTYLSTRIFLKAHNRQSISLVSILCLSLATSFLLSIRISGVLIFLQYSIYLIITFNLSSDGFFKLLKQFFFKIVFFIFFTFLFIFIFYPLYWKNPLLVFDAINYLRNIPYSVCTLTLGNCMDAENLPSSYIFIWLFFKLPIVSLIGLIIFPFVERKIFSISHYKITIAPLLISIISIIFLLIFFEANLYDELRHILYLVPLILIVSFSLVFILFAIFLPLTPQ